MVEDPQDPRSRDDDVVELDRKAWNLPQPLAPVGPVREASPVDESRRGGTKPERPAAA
jgi:hypothetical protein